MILDKLRTLFEFKGKICSENANTNANNSGIINNGTLTVNVLPSEKNDPKNTLSRKEKEILSILAEGGHAVIARDETGVIEQVNMYGHPQQRCIDPVSPEVLQAYQSLLRKGFILEHFDGSSQEYVISSLGRDFLLS